MSVVVDVVDLQCARVAVAQYEIAFAATLLKLPTPGELRTYNIDSLAVAPATWLLRNSDIGSTKECRRKRPAPARRVSR